jgi:3-methyladenine DNA glycosylase/8-oxoguanine DNA glycosylase
MNVQITVDEGTRDLMREMPRKMSASRVLRHVMKAFRYDDDAWSVYAKTDECRELRAFIRPYKRRLGLG